MKTIELSNEMYQRLFKHAADFSDTPENVIKILLDAYEENFSSMTACEGADTAYNTGGDKMPQISHSKLEIRYFPNDSEQEFKEQFLSQGRAHIRIFAHGKPPEIKEWALRGFSPESSVKGNLMSGRLRGWKEKGIYRAEVSTDPADFKA